MTVLDGLDALEEALLSGLVGRIGVDRESVRVKAAGSMDIVNEEVGRCAVAAPSRGAASKIHSLRCVCYDARDGDS